ncbi:MAG: hypothetical protein M0Z55_07930, partial [Peptococcaceae bacterium]|nr:hypothetical protein [Peptococcaceae bacterium]
MNTDKSSLIAKSKQYVQAVLNGDFATIAANLSEGLATQTNASVLKQLWDSAIKDLPAFQGLISADYLEIQGTDAVIV